MFITIREEECMIGPLKTLTVMLIFALFTLVGCAEYAPVEPAANTGTVFQRPLEEMQTATRNALTKLNFAIIKENELYIEAVHLKPGETVEDNESELVGVWFKPKEGSTLVLIDTEKRASGVAKQKAWEQDLMRQIMREL